MVEFRNQKSQRIEHVDLSRKGSIDEPIVELVSFINSLPNYFTTSSCSGRIILFETSNSDEQDTGKPVKKGCNWLFVSHTKVKTSEIEESLSKMTGNAVFKFEAMVMHVQCQTLQDAQLMHQAAVASGFRNSGISVGAKGKIIAGIRSTHSLEAPLSKEGLLLVTPQYYEFLVECANQRMEENLIRIQRFFENVKLLTHKSAPSLKQHKDKRAKQNTQQQQQIEEGNPPSTNQQDRKHLPNDEVENTALHDEENEMCLFMFGNT